MNKRRLAANMIVLAVISFFGAGCSKAEKSGYIEIKEKMFIQQVNDVYINVEDYMGKTIKMEGIFLSEYFDNEIDPHCFVLRYGPGCCGNDGNVGFEVAWAENRKKSYPEENSWVEAVGEIKSYNVEGFQFLYLDLSALNVLKTRGEEYVIQ